MFQVNNRSAWPPTMKDKLSVRYYMDLSELFEAGKGLDDVQITLGENQGAKLIGLKQYKDNIYYFTVDFSGTQIMPAEWEMCEKDANVSIKYKDSNIGSNQNDWSYQNLSGPPDYDAISFEGMTPYIPVYDSGVLLWGEEPLGGEITPTPTIKPTPTPTATNVIYGDLNGDKKVNAIDFGLLRCELLGIPHDEINLAAADVNADGKVNSLDFGVLKMYLLGMISKLP
ncbi:MAG: Endoglucanase G precursor [Firmicutes bacterium ADurb.Bin419]|nr:MAG: Endoglucanase G precursor [Firmicutes bacterium ADurb.Bin419]